MNYLAAEQPWLAITNSSEPICVIVTLNITRNSSYVLVFDIRLSLVSDVKTSLCLQGLPVIIELVE
jgi:hypothetical protein